MIGNFRLAVSGWQEASAAAIVRFSAVMHERILFHLLELIKDLSTTINSVLLESFTENNKEMEATEALEITHMRH